MTDAAPHVLFATAELRPLVSAGGLAEASAGLVAALRAVGLRVTVAVPDYFGTALESPVTIDLAVDDWAAPAQARVGEHPDAGSLALIDVPGIQRPDPYVDADGQGWPDNDARFAAFSAAIGALATAVEADLVHLNDWHTSMAPPFLDESIPTVLTIHNLGHQGYCDRSWLHRISAGRDLYAWGDGVNQLAGAIGAVDAITTVSPTYADEILLEDNGMGLHVRLGERSDDLVGILNGIDARVWDPTRDPFTPPFSANELSGKTTSRSNLIDHVGWVDVDSPGDPLVVMITRLVEQKGVDLAFEAARYLDGMRARMVVLGSGERHLADWGRWLQSEQPDRFWFFDGYDAPLSHLLFAGGDLLLMPSRFEPCGLAQMQAMAYGTIPIVTNVGGLADTVHDVDAGPDGNGIVMSSISEAGTVDGLYRAIRMHRHAGRRGAVQRRAMTTDWSWADPAVEYVELYRRLLSSRTRSP